MCGREYFFFCPRVTGVGIIFYPLRIIGAGLEFGSWVWVCPLLTSNVLIAISLMHVSVNKHTPTDLFWILGSMPNCMDM